MRRRLVVVLGGARGGKSGFAERLAQKWGPRVLFVATAEGRDEEMCRRIEAHRLGRPAAWTTMEAPLHVGQRLATEGAGYDAVLLDCLTMLTSNVIAYAAASRGEGEPCFEDLKAALEAELAALLHWFRERESSLIVVSNEVGMGLVPPYALGRIYRDLLGWANQWLAERADEVYLLVAGLPVPLKALSRQTMEDALGEIE